MGAAAPFCEKVVMPDDRFPIKSFLSLNFEHVLAVHPHWHGEVEMLAFQEGCAIQQIDDHFFPCQPGDVVIIGKNQLHSTYSYQSSSCRILVVMFDAAALLDGSALQSGGEAALLFGNSVHLQNPLKRDGAGEILEELHGELLAKRPGYQALVKSLLYRLSGLLLRDGDYTVENRDSGSQQLTRQVLEKTFRLIDERYFEELSLKTAAAASNLSVPHFCRLFKKATGMTFLTYLSFYRINRAERLLESEHTLASVAMECGFGSVSTFLRNFKKFKECTPSVYKRQKTGAPTKPVLED